MSTPTRRAFLGAGGLGLGGVAMAALARATEMTAAAQTASPARAKRAIWLFMAGGPSQVDLFDHKPGLAARAGEELPPSVRGDRRLNGQTATQARLAIAPTSFGFAQYGGAGAWVSDLLPHTAKIVDDIAIVRSFHTDAINHEPGILQLNTGSQLPGKPAAGAWLSYGLGRLSDELPTFVVLNSHITQRVNVPSMSPRLWSNGFLSAEHGGVLLRSSGDPVLYLQNPGGLAPSERRVTLDLLGALNQRAASRTGDPETAARVAQYELAFRMQSSVPELVNTAGEPASTLELYGPDVGQRGTFAANCLLARRMLERGVRFVQIYHRGWDSHYDLRQFLPYQCRDVDRGCYGLIKDLQQRGMLEDTLVIWSGEFGRTVYSQGDLSSATYGRDHHAYCSSVWLAGGGVKPGIVYGATDDFSYNIAENPVHVRDLHATILHLFGLDANRLSVRHQGLDQRLVGTEGVPRVVTALLR